MSPARSGTLKPEMPPPIPGQLGVSLREASERIAEAQKPSLDPVTRLGVIGVAMSALLHAERDAVYLARQAPRIPDEVPGR